eukprot:gene11917-327_t
MPPPTVASLWACLYAATSEAFRTEYKAPALSTKASLLLHAPPTCGCGTADGCCCSNLCAPSTTSTSDALSFVSETNGLRDSLLTLDAPNLPPAAAVAPVGWDDHLAQLAAGQAMVCPDDSTGGPFITGSLLPEPIGQTILYSGGIGKPTPGQIIGAFGSKKSCYVYDGDGDGLGDGGGCPAASPCFGDCASFRQVIHTGTTAMGCAVQACPSLVVGGDAGVYDHYVMCLWGPSGPAPGQPPYAAATCTDQVLNGLEYIVDCSNGLCVPLLSCDCLLFPSA